MVCYNEEGGLGFRDMTGLKIALLAKQLWNLHQMPHSLVARIMKAKYFKNTSVLEVAVGYNPSFICQSLMGTQEMLWNVMAGWQWRIYYDLG